MKKLNLRIKPYIRFLLAAIFICCHVISLSAKPENSKTKKLLVDSSQVKPNEPTKKSQENYYNDAYWKYERDKSGKTSEPDVFDRLWNNFWDKLFDSLNTNRKGINPWTILLIIIFITLIVLVILKLTNSGVNSVFSGKKTKEGNVDATLEDVDIHNIDYDAEINKAIGRNDYRLAVRLWFLKTLKTFSDKQLVNWKIDKTNSDYFYELSGTKFQNEFGEVSKVYDYIWYGEFPVDEMSYKNAEEKFATLNKKIE